MRTIARNPRPLVRQLVVMGVDPSLTSTGFAYRKDGKLVTGTISAAPLTGPARLNHIERELAKHVVACAPDLIVYEDYIKNLGTKGKAFDIGELGGVLKKYFWQNQIDVMLVSPTALKAAITGRGNADSKKRVGTDKSKPEMRAALTETFGLHITQGDEADATGLMLMGEMRFGSHTVTKLTQSSLRLDALNDCNIVLGRGNKLRTFAK